MTEDQIRSIVEQVIRDLVERRLQKLQEDVKRLLAENERLRREIQKVSYSRM